ncbi:MAG: translocation/assembly module TamB domain-containing protein [Bacteroidales bacterium]|nr:translocation/assembly module TamB domain-containing protein [Bacteroidales bacterium]
MIRILKYLGWVLLVILCLVMLAYLTLQIPYVQTKLAQSVVKSLTKDIDADVNIGEVNIRFFNKVVVKDFSIVSKDTLLSAGELEAGISLRGLLDKNRTVKSLKVTDGVFNLIYETDSTLNIDRIFPASDKNEDKGKSSLDLTLNTLAVNNFRFNLINPFIHQNIVNGQMDFNNLRVSDINLEASDIRYCPDYVSAKIDNLVAKESCGFVLNRFNGDFILNDEGATLKNPDVIADGSNFKGDYLSFGFNDAKDFKDFIRKVRISSRLKGSTLAMKTIGRFAPDFMDSDLELLIDGDVQGTVSNLYSKNISAVSKGGQTSVTMSDVRLKGLTDTFHTRIEGRVNNLTTTGKDLSHVIAGLSGGTRVDFLEQMPPMQVWKYTGNISGTIGHIISDGVLSSGGTSIAVNAAVNAARDKTAPLVSTRVNATDLNLYSLTGSKMLGLFSGRGSVRVLSGTATEGMAVIIDSLSVRKLGINGYNLTGIYGKGKYQDDIFDGKVICHDPALDLMFQGSIGTSSAPGNVYNFYANIPYADLYALNLDKRDSTAILSTFISADLQRFVDNDIFGYLKMDDIVYTNSHGKWRIGDLDATSLFEDGKYVINLVSDFAKARYEGTTMIDGFIDQITNQVLRRHFSNLVPQSEQKDIQKFYGENYSLTLQTLNTQGICAFINPGLYIQQGTSLRVRVTEDDHYRVLLNSGRLAHGSNYLKNVRLTILDRDSSIAASIFSRDIAVAGFTVDSTRLIANAADNRVGFSLRFRNDSTGLNNTNLNASVAFLKDTTVEAGGAFRKILSPIYINVSPSDITLKGQKWNIRESDMIYSDSLITLNGMKIYNGSQMLSAGGTLSEHYQDSLGIRMEKFDIAIVDQFLDRKMNLEGLLSGRAVLSLNQRGKFFGSFRGDSMYVNNSPVGTLYLDGNWNSEQKHYDLSINTVQDGKKKLDITGYYRPEGSYVNMVSRLDDLSLTYFEPLLSDVVSHTSGTLSGNVNLEGPLSGISITSTGCRFNRFGFTVDYLNVPYILDGTFDVNDKGVTIHNNLLEDFNGGTGRVNGGVKWNKFNDIGIDVRISMNNMQGLNTTEKDNEDFYGTVFATGNVGIKGDLQKLVLDITARTERKTFFHIPMSGASSAGNSNILTFRQEEIPVEIDPYDTLYFSKPTDTSNPMEIAVNLNVTATPDANLWLEIDKSTGDIMKATGNGRIGITVNPAKDIFRMSGNYTVQQGSYHFVLMGLASRDFTVQPGSNVAFNGKIGNTALDITALYSTKAAINRLISDTTSVNTSRLVNASLKVSGILDNPQIKFGIDIPDLDPNTKVKVESALNSEDKLQKQFASLLAFGNFTPETESGISSSGNAIYSNATSVLVGQLNNLFMQLDIPLDLGFNYQQGDRSASDAFEVAVSTQLFNNRVIINGSMGNDPYSSSTGRDVKGNIDVEVKMDRQGKIRMTFFSHATDSYSNYLDMSQRTGIGIAYQHEFNRFRDLFRKKSAAQKEYERLLKIKEREERKAAREEKRQAKKKEKEANR